MRNWVRACRVCKREIKVTEEIIGKNFPTTDKCICTRRTSKDGTYFTGSWFCNQCWGEIIEYVEHNR